MSGRPFAAPMPVFAGLVAMLLGAAAFVYRFNQLGGTLGGFENDHFVQLSTARQIVAGDLPFRDYHEIGAPLTTAASAIGQIVGGHALLPDAILTIGMIALGTAITCWLAARASGSVLIATVVTIILAMLAPRPYAYPKVLVYACGILLAWRYVDLPAFGRAVTLGVAVAVAFLFRHDHGAYLGVFAVLTVLAVHGWSSTFVRRAVLVTSVCIAVLLPFFVFVQVNGGLDEYFRRAMAYARRDAERTSFSAPRLQGGSGQPLVRVEPPPPPAPVEVNVRWAPSTSGPMRREREQQYSLRKGEPREGTTWAYELTDSTSRNIAALVRDPQVEDTQGVDRGRFTVSGADGPVSAYLARIRLAPELTSETNALAWLYYLFVSLAPLAAFVGWRRWRGPVSTRVDLPYLLPVIVLMAILSVTLLSRGATAIRLPDASAPLAVVGAGLLIAARRRGGLVRVIAVAIVAVTAGAAVVLGDVPQRFQTAHLDGGLDAALQHTRRVARALAASPPLGGLPSLDHPGSLRLAEYVNACTSRDQRVFILGNYPEVYFFAARPFAGSHVWLVPGFYTSARDQQTIVQRLQRWPVPIVVTEPPAEYESYRPHLPEVTTFLDTHYRDSGTIEFGDVDLRVLVHESARQTGTFTTSNGVQLPCFAETGTRRVAATTP